MFGYDKRTRTSKTLRSAWQVVGSGSPVVRGSSKQQKQETTSWRDQISGQPILAKNADPYGWLLEASTAEKRRLAILRGSDGSDEPPVVDNGHPFTTVKQEWITSHPGTNHFWHYRAASPSQLRGGPCAAYGATVHGNEGTMPFLFSGWVSGSNLRQFTGRITPPNLIGLDAFGKRAIVTLAPAQPQVDLFASIGELLVGFPKVPFRALTNVRRDWYKRGPDEFLNYVFGVQPTINDVTKVLHTLSSMTDALVQLRKDVGKGVRRSLFLPKVIIDKTYSGSQLSSQGSANFLLGNQVGFSPYLNPHGGSLGGIYNPTFTSSLRLQRTTEYVFKGSFSYFLPPLPIDNRDWGRMQYELDRIFRFMPSASGVWQLISFSWLLDWFLDISSSLELVERNLDDSLLINYGYAMRTEKLEATQTTKIATPIAYPCSIGEVSTSAIYTSKNRIRANPFGFIQPEGVEMSPLRWAILGAIGITGAPRGGYN